MVGLSFRILMVPAKNAKPFKPLFEGESYSAKVVFEKVPQKQDIALPFQPTAIVKVYGWLVCYFFNSRACKKCKTLLGQFE